MIVHYVITHAIAILPPRLRGRDNKLLRMLEVSDVTRSFGGTRAVDCVSFTVDAGSITGLIGPNGAGKTTMFNLVAGSLRPHSGRIIFRGAAIEREPAHKRLARGIGRTFQIPRPFGGMTVLENVLVSAQRQGGEQVLPNWFAPRVIAREERRNAERAREIIEFLALGRLVGSTAGALSGGQRKLLELARVLMAEPKLILLDEPAAGVNPTLLETIMDRIVALNARGITFLIVEHNMDLIARLCQLVHVMAAGRMLTSGTPDEVARDPRVIEAYLGGSA
jgi:branched-chain amino acid transport system ATP-binding protein